MRLHQAVFTRTPGISKKQIVPLSVNYHFTRICNYECGFCFHTAKSSNMVSLAQAKQVLQKLANSGMKKLNFAGGEPMLYPEFVGKLAEYCKSELGLESVSIVSNGSKFNPKFFKYYGKYVDIIAISIDSFNEATNIEIGRGNGKHLSTLSRITEWCREYEIKFKINTVVNKLNINEDMNDEIQCLEPFRWKCFQVLILETENVGSSALRNASKFAITDDEFDEFVERHRGQSCLIPESNSVMGNSYLILDENCCFLNCEVGKGKVPSSSLLDV